MKTTPIKKYLVVVVALLLLILSTFICIKLIPFIYSLKSIEKREKFEAYINNLGFKGFLLFLTIQILQIIIAFIPGEIVELLAGVLYGPWGGLLVCLLGNFIASFVIYYIVKIFAHKYMNKFQRELKLYSFLNNKKKISLYLFLIYLIPGIPKDIITYIVPFLPIKFISFIIITSIARIPSIITSTYSSNLFLNSHYSIAILLFVIFSILTLFGFIFKDKILFSLKNNDENINSTSK